ncbi:protein SCAR2 isoform X1 [Morus notabilis]|nr:protein SCAR2 isoform X1 [Morus notabilis]
MPLTRYRVRSEYGLADPELYRAADKDDPEALLEGVAMAGLVGVLRQLGDLAEFAAEIFHDLHEEVMATATRGHGLMARVQQLEAEFPPIEKALLSQTNLSSFFYNAGVDWHPNLRSEQNLIACGDLPRFVMDSYEEARGPPRLFLLDKFDVAGAGACLKRYTDPSFFKVDAASSLMETVEIQREKKSRKVKRKGLRWRNVETTPEVVPTSHTKLHQLFLEERIENGHSDPARLVKLKKRQLNGSVVDSKTGKSYMEKFVENPLDRELACETSIIPATFTSDYTSESGIRILEISMVSPVENSPRDASACSSPSVHEVVLKPSMNGFDEEAADAEIVKVPDPLLNDETVGRLSTLHEVQVEKQLAIDRGGKTKVNASGYESDDITSELDNYMDALASMESEIETDNEYRSNGNLRFLKADIHRADSDANEEHLERGAHLSDSQSVGNFSTSDDGNNSFKKNRSSFSYSDTPSSLAEITPSDSDVGVKAFPSTEISGAEIVNEPLHELSVTAESLGDISDEHVVSHLTCIKEENTPVHEDVSSIALHVDMHPTTLQSDPGETLSTASLVEPEGGTPTEYFMPESKAPNSVDNGTNLVDLVAQVSSQIDDDFTETSGGYHVDESDAMPHLSNISEASDEENRDSSVDEVLQTEDEIEDLKESLVTGKIDSPRTSGKEKQLSSSLPDLESCSANFILPASSDHSEAVEPDGLESKLDNTVTATEVDSEDLPTMVDTGKSHISEEVPSTVDSLQTPGMTEQQYLHFTERKAHLDPNSAESGVPYSKEKPNIEEISGSGHFEEIGLSTSYVGSDRSNVTSLERPSRYLTDPGDNDHAVLDEVSSTVVVEDQAINSADATSVVDSVGNGICLPSDVVYSPSRNPTNLLESLAGFMVPSQKEVELDEGACPEAAMERETQKELCHGEVASTDSDLNTSTPVYYYHSSSKIDDNNDDLPLDERTQNSLSAIDITAASSLDLRGQQSELIHSSNSYHLEDREYAVALPTSSVPEPETTSEKSQKLRANLVDGEWVVTDDAGRHPESPLEQSESRVDQLDARSLQVDQPSINSSSLPSEEMESLNHMAEERGEHFESQKHIDQGIYVDAALESCKEDLPIQSSTSQFSSKSAGQDVDNVNQTPNPLEPACPSIGKRPEAAEINFGEMPPMPPLPPMQWRMGKFQHAFLDGCCSLFPPIQPYGADEKGQVELPTSQGGIHHTQNLLPLTIVENEKSLHVAVPLAGSFAQPPTYSLQLPTTVNDANGQYNYITSGGTQSLNPFLTLPAVSSERCEQGEKVQPDSSPFPPTPTTQGKSTHSADVSLAVTHPLNQQAPGADTMTHHWSSQYSEGEGNPFVTSIPPPPVAEEQVRFGLLMPEGETPWSSNNSSTMSESEVGKPNGNAVNKLPRPRNPLIDAVNAHGKSKLRKVTERVRPQIGPKADERDSLLEQIRTKSFYLKPAAATRPSIPGPTKTNLKVAAILEKANAIRQALAGSDDEHDDDDSWSDS